jgi:Tol biopolymer transport system component
MVGRGETVQLEATAKDAGGATLAGRTIIWSSTNTTVASVSPTGVVTGEAVGSTTITATSEGRSGTAAITVAVLGQVCPDSGAPDDRCARVVGTVRDLAGLPVVAAWVGAIPAGGVAFRTRAPVETDAEGRFELEVLIAVSNDPPAAIDTFAAYVRATLELEGDAAIDTSALTQMVFVLHGTRPPVQTTDLVINRHQAFPAPSSRIVFVHDPDGQDPDLYVINADGSGRRPLLVDPTWDVDPSWTPDGAAVLFTDVGEAGSGFRLSLIDADGGNLRPFGAGLSGGHPRWAPDGKHLAFLAGYTDDGGRGHRAGLWIANPDGTEPYRLPTHDDQVCEDSFCSYIYPDPPNFGWYPDADRIGYKVAIEYRSGHFTSFRSLGVYTSRLSDSTLAPIVGPFPVWAPDGSRYVVLEFNLIRIMAADGTPLVTIPVGSSSPTFPEAVWSRDSEWLVYVFREPWAWRSQLWIADRDGNRRRRITLDAKDPDWEPTPAALR